MPSSAALRPGGNPELETNDNGVVPPLTLMAPEKPDWFTVQAVVLSVPSVGAGLMVIDTAAVAVAPLASLIMTLPLENVPVDRRSAECNAVATHYGAQAG